MLENEIHYLKKELKTCPDGKLICSKTGKYTKWYHSDGHEKTYIPKNEQAFAEKLAAKKYLSHLLEEAIQKKRAIETFLKHYHFNDSKALQLLTAPGYQELLQSHFKPQNQEINDWLQADYQKNPHHPENLIHLAASGNYVRSKSEAIIDMCLTTNQIPFRYECALTFDGFSIFPDFTIMHPETGEILYWEHFGLMDNPGYSKNAFTKLQIYYDHGIIPGIHLIMTFETRQHPLSVETVKRTIETYF